ncbi:hypothetical protein Tco_1251927 [Tanacetum coccineum]
MIIAKNIIFEDLEKGTDDMGSIMFFSMCGWFVRTNCLVFALKVGSYISFSSGPAHLLCLIVLYLEKAAPRKHVMVAIVMVLTIVISSHDHPSTILYKFVMSVTIVPICVSVGDFAIAFANVISSERLNRNFVRPITSILFTDRNFDDEAIAVFGLSNAYEGFVTQMCVMEADNAKYPTDPTTAHPAPVFSQLNSKEGFVTQMCVMEADNVERPIDKPDDTQSLFVVESASDQQKIAAKSSEKVVIAAELPESAVAYTEVLVWP